MNAEAETIDFSPEVDLLLAGVNRAQPVKSVRPHGLTCWGLMYFVSGRCLFESAPDRVTADPGDLVLTRPKTPLFYELIGDPVRSEICWVLFQPPVFWGPLLQWPMWSRPGIMRVSLTRDAHRRHMLECFRSMQRTQHDRKSLGPVKAMHILQTLFINVFEWIPGLIPDTRDARIEEAIHHMQGHLHEALDVGGLAREVGLSTSRFASLFRRETGSSPMDYLTRLRIHRASLLLGSTPMLIKQIAAEVGYPEPANFTACFRKQVGCSPRRYRETHRR